MTTTRLSDPAPQADAFCHEALLYAGEREFVSSTAAFIRGGLEADEPCLVVVSARKIDQLRSELDGDDRQVLFADMADVGRNPARIIPAWRDFLNGRGAGGRRVRGIGEPIWAGRGPDELVESQRHESLLNLAFDGAPAWWLLCPYDTETLDPLVVEEAHRSHPFVLDGGVHRPSVNYSELDQSTFFDDPLPGPRARPDELRFDVTALDTVREFVGQRARSRGLSRERTDDLVLAVNELATNTVRHAGGRGVLRVWEEDGRIICEVADDGIIDQPLVGREFPPPNQENGRGLWLVTQMCDLVQIRSLATGTVVRLHMELGSGR